MDSKERKGIRLVVEDEKTLYSAFSPEDEFDWAVKSYIRSKLADGGHRQSVDMTVIRTEKWFFREIEKTV